MRRRSIFHSKNNSLFPVEDVFIDLKNYYDKIIGLLVYEGIDLQTDIQLNDKVKIDTVKRNKDAMKDGLKQEELLNYENNKMERLMELTSNFPNVFRRIFVTQIYGFIEEELSLICPAKLLRKREKNNKDTRPDIEKLEECICFYWSIPEVSIYEEFEFIKNVRKIRNNIVHSSGSFNIKDKTEIEGKWGKTQKLFEFQKVAANEFQIVFIRDSFVYEFLNKGENLFKKILNSNFSIK